MMPDVTTGTLEVGQTIDGKYRIEAVVGRGGMGVVYRAHHLALGAPRAIKVMNRELAENADFRRRFLNEARVAARLRHENIVSLHDLSEMENGNLYIVWEYVEGDTVAQELELRDPFDPNEVSRIVGQAADGMTVAHRQGIVHGDLSPDNLMLTRNDEGKPVAKVLDFGMAKVMEGVSRPGLKYTTMGIALGKIGYCSPEQITQLETGEELDGRSDVFSLAVVAYRMLVGRLPFRSSSIHAFVFDVTTALEQQVRERYGNPLPEPWRQALSRALRRDRAERTPSMEAFKTDVAFAARAVVGIPVPELPPATTEPDPQEIDSRERPAYQVTTRLRASRRSQRGWRFWSPVAALSLILAGFGWLLLRSGHDGKESLSSPQVTSGPPVSEAGAGPPPVESFEPEPIPPSATRVPERPPPAEPSPDAPTPAESRPAESTNEAPLSLDPASSASETETDEPPKAVPVEEPAPTAASTVVSPGRDPDSSPEPEIRSYGSLAVTSELWVEVSLDGGEPRQTPVVFRGLPVGAHRLVARRAGYLDETQEVLVEEGRTSRVTLSMRKAP